VDEIGKSFSNPDEKLISFFMGKSISSLRAEKTLSIPSPHRCRQPVVQPLQVLYGDGGMYVHKERILESFSFLNGFPALEFPEMYSMAS
jgi:hypothetical protein